MAPNPQQIAAIKRALKTADEAGIARSHARGMVKGLDMTPEGRMARAREMGFDTSRPVFHGTPDSRGLRAEGFKTMQERMGQEDPTRTFFAADSKKVADSYADDSRAWDYQNATPETLPLYLRSKNPTTVDWGGRPFRGRETDGSGYAIRDYIDQARANGSDQVVIKNVVDTYDAKGKPSTIRAFFDPSAARSPFATFDPARANRRDLLAATIPAAALGAGALALQPDDAEAAPRMTPEEVAALKRSIKAATVNDNRTDDLQSLRASLQGAQKGPDLRVVSGAAAGLAPGAADAGIPWDKLGGRVRQALGATKDIGRLAVEMGDPSMMFGAADELMSEGVRPDQLLMKTPGRAVDNVRAMGYDVLKRVIKQMQADAEMRKQTDIKTYR